MLKRTPVVTEYEFSRPLRISFQPEVYDSPTACTTLHHRIWKGDIVGLVLSC